MRSRVEYVDRLETILREVYSDRPKANVLTFGCAQNENDSEKIRGLLVDIGYSMTDDLDDSDIIGVVAAYDRCRVSLAVVQSHLDLVSSLDNVEISYDVAVLSEDNSGACALSDLHLTKIVCCRAGDEDLDYRVLILVDDL